MFNFSLVRKRASLVALSALLTLNACVDHRTPPSPAQVDDVTIFLLNQEGQLLQTSTRTPSTPTAIRNLTGLQSGEQIVGIDFRPATGQLYGVSNQSRLFVIDQMTGSARAVATLGNSLSGTPVGFDFNPTVDLIRVVTAQGQNLRVSPITGASTTDVSISGAAGAQIQGVAYTANRAGATTTMLYDIDPVTDWLYQQNANAGTLTSVGGLGIDISGVGGFDIAPDGRALATVVYAGVSELSLVNLTTGLLQKLGNLPGNIIGLAIPTEPVAYAVEYDNVNNNLLIFNPTQANPTITRRPITGLGASGPLYSIDFRPKTGQLYGLGSNRLYTINVATGEASPASGTITGSVNAGFDFNPVTDRIRLINGVNSTNYSLDPDTGVQTRESDINGDALYISGAAYSNNYAGASTTTLYTVGSTILAAVTDLYTQTPPSSGTQRRVGNTGTLLSYNNGFDIGGQSGTAYLLVSSFSFTGPSLYRVNLNTGTLTPVSTLTGVSQIYGLALGLGF